MMEGVMQESGVDGGAVGVDIVDEMKWNLDC